MHRDGNGHRELQLCGHVVRGFWQRIKFRGLHSSRERTGVRVRHDYRDIDPDRDKVWYGQDHSLFLFYKRDDYVDRRGSDARIDNHRTNGNVRRDRERHWNLQQCGDVDSDGRHDHAGRCVYAIGRGNCDLHGNLVCGWIHEYLRVGDDSGVESDGHHHIDCRGCIACLNYYGANVAMLSDRVGDWIV